MKKLTVIMVTIILVSVGAIGYVFYANEQTEKRGREKFQQAISEIIVENPEYNNPCLGAHVKRQYAFSDLDKKTI